MYLSIIIPVYNVEEFVERCILSCEKQDFPNDNYELIIVNDGSTDKSLQIVERIANDFKNIRIINQCNSGLSAARNTGLSNAQGDYVWFIDSDDWIAENCFGEIMYRLSKDNLDGLHVGAANHINGELERIGNLDLYDGQIMSGIEFKTNGINFAVVCAPFTIYKRTLLEKYQLQFMLDVFHEDVEFDPRVYYYMNKVGIYSTPIYFINQNPNSITRTINPKKSIDLIKIAYSLDNFQRQINNRNYARYISRMIALSLNSSVLGTKHMTKNQIKIYRKILKENKRLFKHFLYSNQFKFQVEWFLFVIFSGHADCVYHLFNTLFYKRNLS